MKFYSSIFFKISSSTVNSYKRRALAAIEEVAGEMSPGHTLNHKPKGSVPKRLEDLIQPGIRVNDRVSTVNEIVQNSLPTEIKSVPVPMKGYRQFIEIALERMTPVQRRLFKRYFVDGLSPKEISKITDVDPSTVNQTKQRIVKDINTLYEAWQREP